MDYFRWEVSFYSKFHNVQFDFRMTFDVTKYFPGYLGTHIRKKILFVFSDVLNLAL